jgi:hypothetical protein
MTRAPNLTRELEAVGPIPLDAMTRAEARARANAFYRTVGGRKVAPSAFLSQTGKLEHSEGYAVGLQLRPGDASGVEACSWRTAGCTAVCVVEESPRGRWANVRDGRSMRTLFLREDPAALVVLIAHELRALVRKHGRVAFRPNIASDIRWEYVAPDLFGIDGVAGYDYTKANPLKHRGTLPNYRLTYSVSEHPLSEAIADAYVKSGGTAAVVVRTPKHDIPTSWHGMPTVDGDATDDRTTDPMGVFVVLAEKIDGKADGKLRAGSDRTGFVKPLPLAVAS